MALVQNEMLTSEPIPLSQGRTCIYSARANFHGLCSGHSWLSYKVEIFSFDLVEREIQVSKRMAFNFQN